MLLTLASYLLVLSLLVLVHEMGRFLAAKVAGLGVRRFALGFGPATRLRFWWRDTELLVRWIPLGGRVTIADGGDDPLPARIFVTVSGVIANLLAAWLIYSGLSFYGRTEASTATMEPRVGVLAPGSPAMEAGLLHGDLIMAVSGEPIISWEDLVDAVADRPGEPLMLSVERAGGALEVAVTPAAVSVRDPLTGEERRVGRIGVGPLIEPVRVRAGFWQAWEEGARRTWGNVSQLFSVLRFIVSRDISPRILSGPIQTRQAPAPPVLVALLGFVAFLSIQVAIVNLLPIPPLAGGRLCLLLLEGIRGKPLSANVQRRLSRAGLFLILGLAAVAWLSDLASLLRP